MIPTPSIKRLILAIFILLLAICSLVFVFYGEDETLKPATLLVSPEGLIFEEDLAPSLADQVNQADFAIAETLRRLGLPETALVVADEEVRNERGVSYRYRNLRVYLSGLNALSESNVPDRISEFDDIPLFVNTLRDCLLAWAAEAQLLREIPLESPQENLPDTTGKSSDLPKTSQKTMGSSPDPSGPIPAVWNIVMQGVVTHSLNIYMDASGTEAGDVQSGTKTGGTPALRPEGSPRLVIVIDDLGESPRQARQLLALGYPVTFAVWPRSTRAVEVARLAAAQGREVIIHQPMEPVAYPEVSAGAGALLGQMSEERLLGRLRANLNLLPQASGLNNHMGSRLTQNSRAMELVAGELKQRGLLALDSLTHPDSQFAHAATRAGLQTYRRDIFLDVQPDKQSVLSQLKKAEQIASLRGQAIAIGHPLPGTLEALQEWQTLRNPAIQLVRLRDLVPLGAVSQ